MNHKFGLCTGRVCKRHWLSENPIKHAQNITYVKFDVGLIICNEHPTHSANNELQPAYFLAPGTMAVIYPKMSKPVQSISHKSICIDTIRYNALPSTKAMRQKVYIGIGPETCALPKKRNKEKRNKETKKEHHKVWNTGGRFSHAFILSLCNGWNWLNRDKYSVYTLYRSAQKCWKTLP